MPVPTIQPKGYYEPDRGGDGVELTSAHFTLDPTEDAMAGDGAHLNALTLLRPDGSPVRIYDLHRGPVVIVFLRHLA